MALIARMLLANATHNGRRSAVVWGTDKHRSWAEVSQRSGGLARGLLDRGLAPGDRVALVSDNVPEILESYFAAAGSGLVVAPASPRAHPSELDRYFGEYIEPAAVLLGPGSEEAIGGWVDRCRVVVRMPGGPMGEPYDELVSSGGTLRDDIDPDVPYTIAATSGTMGHPKGAVITQRMAASAIFSFVAENPIATDDAYLLQHPMSNIPGGPGQLFALPKAARTVLLERFDAALCLETIERQGITHTVLVPTMLGDLLAHERMPTTDVSSLRVVVIGASPIPRPLLSRGVERFGAVFRPMYGMTETTAVACVLRPQDMYPVDAHPDDRLASAGVPTAGIDLKVVRDDGSEVNGDGTEFGEILIRGVNVAQRYWGDIDENTTAWDGEYFRSGDMSTVDERGFLTIVDRKKDVIISGGTNVASREVEEVILAMDGIGQVAVIGVPDERWGEAVTAVVVPTDASDPPSEVEVLTHCRRHLKGPKVPKSVHVVDSLPLSPMGKVLKRQIRADLT
ncbi:MAG: class I adenylate-forming enzyme family protein [Microthrixaceae bacterium]